MATITKDMSIGEVLEIDRTAIFREPLNKRFYDKRGEKMVY